MEAIGPGGAVTPVYDPEDRYLDRSAGAAAALRTAPAPVVAA